MVNDDWAANRWVTRLGLPLVTLPPSLGLWFSPAPFWLAAASSLCSLILSTAFSLIILYSLFAERFPAAHDAVDKRLAKNLRGD